MYLNGLKMVEHDFVRQNKQVSINIRSKRTVNIIGICETVVTIVFLNLFGIILHLVMFFFVSYYCAS